MFAGSLNFDQRSLHINNEIGLLFHDKEIPGLICADPLPCVRQQTNDNCWTADIRVFVHWHFG